MSSTIDFDKIRGLPSHEKNLIIAQQIIAAINQFSALLKDKGIPNKIQLQVTVET